MSSVIVTGAAGFIGFHVSQRLLDRGDKVVGFDNLSPYYDVSLKEARLSRLMTAHGFRFVRGDLAATDSVEGLFREANASKVIHLAAQAGVRYSLEAPHEYVQSNLVGFANLVECCRRNQIEHLVYASSSSVYGANGRLPFSVEDNVDHPMSLYAATKKSNELMAHAYSHLFRVPATGLRFFTVYGPWGRPDMAMFLFTKAILEGRAVRVFNHGDMRRDFTYVDDVVEGVIRVLDQVAQPDPEWDAARPTPGSSNAPHRVYNIGNHKPEPLMKLIGLLEDALGKKAVRDLLPMQPGDVAETCADINSTSACGGFCAVDASGGWRQAFPHLVSVLLPRVDTCLAGLANRGSAE